MDRLAAFQATNEANVTQAEDELRRMHAALLATRQAQSDAEAAAEEAHQLLLEQRGELSRVGGAMLHARQQVELERERLGARDDEAARLALNHAHEARLRTLGRAAQQRKYLLLLQRRVARQAALRGRAAERIVDGLL
eukprot:6959982-Prymnesium_polylepis.1